MPVSTAQVMTEKSAHRLEQLLASLDPTVVTQQTHERLAVELAGGVCVVEAATAGLQLTATGVDPKCLKDVQHAIASALTEPTEYKNSAIDWTAPCAGEDLEILHPVVDTYLMSHCSPADDVLSGLATTTRERTGRAAGMQVSHDEGVLLTLLTRLVNARFAVEVGTFTGYSSLCIARGLAEDGSLLTCDISNEWTAVGRPFWERAGVADRIDLRLGPALDTLRALPDEPRIDIAFIDADKDNYPWYYEEIVRRLRSGGLVVLDNVLLGGRVLDPMYGEAHHVAVRELNDFVAQDNRVESVMLPVRDGVTLARKRCDQAR